MCFTTTHDMLALKKARKLIEANPTSDSAKTLAELVLALDNESSFVLADIYKLDYKSFEIALEILNEWRLDRYYAKKLRLVDVSQQAQNPSVPEGKEEAPGK